MDPKVKEIMRLAREYARQCYRSEALVGHDELEIGCLGIGLALSRAVEWDGSAIAIAAAEAFEDANFHDKAGELRDWAKGS